MNMTLLTFGLVAFVLSTIVLLMLLLVFNLEMLIINIKYIEIIHLITLLTINTNHYENKQTIVVSCNHTNDASYHTIIESRAN